MVLQVENLSKHYKHQRVLDDINFSASVSDVIAVVGKSGAGKSTLLQCLAQIELPDSGAITVQRETVNYPSLKKNSNLNSHIGMVFQQYHLWPHLTVLGNVTLAARKVLKLSMHSAESKAVALLERLSIHEKCNHYPSQLSGGEQQRVALARALMMDPTIMLFDEPTAALDPTTKNEVGCLLKELASTGKTLLISTHDMDFAQQIATHILFIDGGKIVLYEKTATVFGKGGHSALQHFLSYEH